MRLAFNTYRDRLTRDDFRFARQCGCTDVVTGLIDVNVTWHGRQGAKPVCRKDDPIWSMDSLKALKRLMNEEGLQWYAIENFNPADWYDVLLDGPEKISQMDHLKRLISNIGSIGIKSFGYNFSLSGVYGRVLEQAARGGAMGMCFHADAPHLEEPSPLGEIWDMVYDPEAPEGYQPIIDNEELWDRCKWFLEQIVPVAEEAGVIMAAHPDDPPAARMRGNAKLIYKLNHFRKLTDLVPSRHSAIELCLGTMKEMDPDGKMYETVADLAANDRVAYVHLRNVIGYVPDYQEVFIDEGEIDVPRILKTLHENGYHGPVVPDHVPEMTVADSWHTSTAYALGYIHAVLKTMDMLDRD